MKPIMIILAAALLAACTTVKPPITQTVEIPVITPCVKMVPVAPDYEFDQLPATASDGDKVLALARDWIAGRKYEGQQAVVIEGCR